MFGAGSAMVTGEDKGRGIAMIYWKQLKSLAFHKWYVLRAGIMIGNIPLWRLIIHDWSKLTPIEFINYARFKYGIKSIDGWVKAWSHHLHNNLHHPEYWVLSWRGDPDYYVGMGKGLAPFVVLLPMTETYVREMIADMHGTSRETTGSWNISMWLNENGSAMHFHDETVILIDKVMKEVGYIPTDNCMWSYMAGSDFKWLKKD